MAKIKSIRKVGENVPQKCIKVSNSEGLFALGNGIITHNSPEFVMRMWNDAVGRVNSRMKGNYYGRAIIDSSPNDFNNPIDHYIWYDAPKDPSAYIVKGSMWEWRPEDYDFSETFHVI